MSPTPRGVPAYERTTIHTSWYYCLSCKHTDASEFAIKKHVTTHHEEESPDKGIDYTTGDHLHIMLDRWDDYCLRAVDRFQLQLRSLRGGDDLVHEIGAGIADA